MLRAFFRFSWKTGRWLLLFVLLLLVAVFVAGWYLLATDSGYRQIPVLVNHLTPYRIHYSELEGNLLHRQRWENLSIEGPGIRFQAQRVETDCGGTALLQRRVHCKTLSVENGELRLPAASGEEKTASPGLPGALPQVRLPLRLDIERFSVAGFAIYRQEKRLATVTKSVVSTHVDGSELRLSAEVAFRQANGRKKENQYLTTLDGRLTLSGDYPLSLGMRSEIRMPEKVAQTAALQIDGSLLAPRATLRADGWLQADLSLEGRVSLGERTVEAALLWREVALDGERLRSPEGRVRLNGGFDDLLVSVRTAVSGTRVPAVRIAGKGQFGPHTLETAELTMQTLGGEIALRGNADFGAKPRWQGELVMRDIDLGQYDTALDAQLNGEFVASGGHRNGTPFVRTAIRSLTGQWNGRPITGGGGATYRDEQLRVERLRLDVAGNTLAADGSLARDGDLEVVLTAPALQHLVPGLSGAANANVRLSGTFSDPVLNAAFDWKELRLLRNGEKTPLFASRNGTLTARGDLHALQVEINARAAGEGLPESELSGGAIVSRTAARAIDLSLKTLDGLLRVRGDVRYDKQLQWQVNGQLRGIDPQQWLPSLQGKVDAQVSSSGAIEADGTLHARVEMPALSGSWSGQPLSGNMNARIDGVTLSLQTLALAVGQNTIEAEGELGEDEFALDFALDAPRLAVFHPALRGALQGEGRITGTPAAPEIRATLEGRDLAFEENKIERLSIRLDNVLKKGGVFVNKLTASGVSAVGRHWSAIALDSAGTFDAHTLTMKTAGGAYNLLFSAQGGGRDLRHWQGKVDTLKAFGPGFDWSLGKPVAVLVSPERLSFDDLCLADRYSAFCLTLEKRQQTALSYRIEAIDPRSFAPFMPATLQLATQLKGDGKLILGASGAIEGKAALSLTPGEITIASPNQAPITLAITSASWQGRFIGEQGKSDLDIRFADAGRLAARAQINDLRQPNVRGTLDIHLPDIAKFKYFIPRVSELQGRIDGDLAFAGPVGNPQISGHLTLDNGKVVIPEYASELKNIHLRLSAEDAGAIGIDGKIGTAKGDMTAKGALHLQPPTLHLTLSGKDMLLANAKKVRVLATPDFDIRIDPKSGIVVKGEVLIPEAKIDIPDRKSAHNLSEDVIIVDDGKEKKPPRTAADSRMPLRADIAVKLGEKVFFHNEDISIRLIGGVSLAMRPGEAISGKGRIEVASGVYELYGQDLDIERGWATFSGAITRPVIDVLALREVENVKAGARVSGTPQNLHLELTSRPALPDSAILSYLLFGRPPDAATDGTALLQTAAAIGTKGFFPDDIGEKTGLDVFDIGIGGLKAGKYLFRDLYVGMKSDFFSGITKFLTRYRLTKRLSVEASAQALENVVDFLYEFETD